MFALFLHLFLFFFSSFPSYFSNSSLSPLPSPSFSLTSSPPLVYHPPHPTHPSPTPLPPPAGLQSGGGGASTAKAPWRLKGKEPAVIAEDPGQTEQVPHVPGETPHLPCPKTCPVNGDLTGNHNDSCSVPPFPVCKHRQARTRNGSFVKVLSWLQEVGPEKEVAFIQKEKQKTREAAPLLDASRRPLGSEKLCVCVWGGERSCRTTPLFSQKFLCASASISV